MAETLQFEIVTPDRMVVQDRVEEVQIPAKSGYLGILPGHAPLIAEMAIGEISYRVSGQTRYLAVAWGFAEILPDKVTILAENAERAEDIDTGRAQEALQRAEQRLKSNAPDLNYDRALDALKRAEVRLDVAKHIPGSSPAH